jgi:hypothetical protein
VQSSNGHGHGAIARTAPDADAQHALAAGLTAFATALQSLASNPAKNSENPQNPENFQKLFLTVPEAAAISGFSQAYLRRKCQAGWTGAIKDGAWKIRRRDLEAL